MSRILRRPMFRGGKVDSRGTGITSGLSYGGRVGLQGGGMPPSGSTFNINMGGRTPIPTQSTIPTGGGIMDKIRNLPYLGRLIPAAGGKIAAASPFIAGGAGGIGLGMLADFYARGSSTPEGYARLKEMSGPNFNFDETNIDVGDVLSYIDEGNQMGEKYGFFPRGGKAKRLEELGLADKYDPKTGKRIELPEVLDDLTKNNNKGGAGTGGTGGDDPEKSIEESLEIDKEKFAKLLGSDRARGQDIADMLLSFSSKALAPEADVKSAFAEFAADEVKRPSRLQKIEDNAAALAINKYIKGEISKAEMDKLVQLNRIKIADQIELSKAATSLDMALQEAVKSGVGSSKKSIAVIQSAVDRILGDKYDFGGPLPEGEGAAEKISEGVIYVRDSASVKGAKELITIDPSTGTLKVLKTIF